MPYEWRGSGSLRRPDEQIQPGETFEPTDDEISAFGDLMAEVEAAGADANPGVDADETGSQDAGIDEQIDAGVCPWCDDYEGDYLGQHASSAHPDEWDDYSG